MASYANQRLERNQKETQIAVETKSVEKSTLGNGRCDSHLRVEDVGNGVGQENITNHPQQQHAAFGCTEHGAGHHDDLEAAEFSQHGECVFFRVGVGR